MARTLKTTKTPAIGTTDKVTLVREFLEENYEIRINEFDTSKSYVVSKIKQYDHSISFNDIYLHLLEEGISVGTNVLKMILTSPNYSKTCNPVVDYFENIKGKYRGESQIDILCSHIKAREFEDQPEGYYQQRATYIINKWLVSAVACALGIRPNDVALGLVSAHEGIGKTWFFEFLVPDELKEYYKASDKDPDIFDMTKDFTRNFMVNFDELVGITKARADMFKKVMSAKKLSIKRPREEFSQLVNRIASAAFTSNRTPEMGGFLQMEMGLRRFGIIEIDGIDISYSQKVDVDQLWAEATMLLEQDFDYVFNTDDYNAFKEFNVRYLVQSSSAILVNLHYERPESEADGTWMMASEILKELKQHKKILMSMGLINEITIGMALTAQGFLKKGIKEKEIGTRYKYLVKSKL